MSKNLRRLAVVAVFSLICFLSFSSQYLFAHIEPHPLQRKQSLPFNILIASLLICFVRVCNTNPGSSLQISSARLDSWSKSQPEGRVRFCRKCKRPKPDRWHHCKTCGSCIPKMDHHCIWVNNCVSYRTFPHFIRFLLYSVLAMCYLQYFLFVRFRVLWDNRNLPHVRCLMCSLTGAPNDDSQYLGPSPPQFVHLLILGVASFFAHFILSILLLYSAYGLLMNVTTIEGWEIERHEALATRARRNGGYAYGPGGIQVRIRKQEFPYDVGFWRNVILAMGSSNPLTWFWPFASTPSVPDALDWEVNGFEGESSCAGRKNYILIRVQTVLCTGHHQTPRNFPRSSHSKRRTRQRRPQILLSRLSCGLSASDKLGMSYANAILTLRLRIHTNTAM